MLYTFMDNSSARPRNRHIDILRAFAIILVVIGHTGTIPGAEWGYFHFPLMSYHMALFLFISGYLFRDLTWGEYPSFLWRKTKNLALPLIGWNIVYAGIVSILSAHAVVDYLQPIQGIWTYRSLFIEPFVTGHQYILNLATWFVGMLYPALLLYGIMNILLRRWVTDHGLMALYTVIAVAGLALTELRDSNVLWIVPLHASYALFFIHFGKYYRQYIEPRLASLNSWIIISVCALFQYLTVQIGGWHLYSPSFMLFDGRIVMPLLMAITGVIMWTHIARIVEKYVVPNKLEKAISQSTWDIMTHHIFVKFMIGWVLVHWAIEPELISSFRSTIWFVPTKFDYWGLVFLEVALPVLWHYVFEYMKKPMVVMYSRLKSSM